MEILRALSANLRKSNIDEDKPWKDWDHRRPYVRELIRRIKPAVIGAQEATVEQCDDLMSDFLNWTYAGGVRFGNVPILWDTGVLFAEEHTLFERKYPSGERERYLTLIRLEHRTVEWGGWFGSIHLARESDEEPNAASLRAEQMKAIVRDVQDWVSIHPHAEDAKPNIIIMGDLNDYRQTSGVRKVAYDQGGWKHLRLRLPLDKIGGDSLRSFNGWGSTHDLPHDGRWIDDILTSGITLQDAALRRTCTDTLSSWASDHNWISADIAIS